MLLSIIIVNYNVKYFVEQCIQSILQSKEFPIEKTEIFVVDNLSKDKSVEYLSTRFDVKHFPNIRIIANKRNVGFGRANNQVLDEARGKYILFLNPDTVLTSHTLHDVIEQAEQLPKMGALGVEMLTHEGYFALESRRGLPSPWTACCKLCGLTKLFPKSKLFGRYYMQYLPKEKVNAIDIVSGAFMLTKTETLKTVGSFDQTFFMYGEDIDLSYRMLKASLQNYYVPTPILHYKGESTKKNTFKYVHVFYEAMLIFFKKHYKHYSFILSFPIKCAIILRAIIALINQQAKFLRKYLYPYRNDMPKAMLYIGHSSDMVKQIATDYGLRIDYLTGDEKQLPGGHNDLAFKKKSYQYVIYDTDDFSYDFILNCFKKLPNKYIKIATFNPNVGVLITAQQVFTI